MTRPFVGEKNLAEHDLKREKCKLLQNSAKYMILFEIE
jgi:hypothetical protein